MPIETKILNRVAANLRHLYKRAELRRKDVGMAERQHWILAGEQAGLSAAIELIESTIKSHTPITGGKKDQ